MCMSTCALVVEEGEPSVSGVLSLPSYLRTMSASKHATPWMTVEASLSWYFTIHHEIINLWT